VHNAFHVGFLAEVAEKIPGVESVFSENFLQPGFSEGLARLFTQVAQLPRNQIRNFSIRQCIYSVDTSSKIPYAIFRLLVGSVLRLNCNFGIRVFCTICKKGFQIVQYSTGKKSIRIVDAICNCSSLLPDVVQIQKFLVACVLRIEAVI